LWSGPRYGVGAPPGAVCLFCPEKVLRSSGTRRRIAASPVHLPADRHRRRLPGPAFELGDRDEALATATDQPQLWGYLGVEEVRPDADRRRRFRRREGDAGDRRGQLLGHGLRSRDARGRVCVPLPSAHLRPVEARCARIFGLRNRRSLVRIQSGAFLRVPLRTGIWLWERECHSASQSPRPNHAAGLHASPAADRYITATFVPPVTRQRDRSLRGSPPELHRPTARASSRSPRGRSNFRASFVFAPRTRGVASGSARCAMPSALTPGS
jgi:hypothetical protein